MQLSSKTHTEQVLGLGLIPSRQKRIKVRSELLAGRGPHKSHVLDNQLDLKGGALGVGALMNHDSAIFSGVVK